MACFLFYIFLPQLAKCNVDDLFEGVGFFPRLANLLPTCHTCLELKSMVGRINSRPATLLEYLEGESSEIGAFTQLVHFLKGTDWGEAPR